MREIIPHFYLLISDQFQLSPGLCEYIIPTKATIIAARMTRIKRIHADFALPAAKFFCHESHEFSRIEAQTSFARKRVDMNVVNVKIRGN